LEKQIVQLSDSIELLYDIKRKADSTKRQQKMLEDLNGDSKDTKKNEVKEEIRRLRNDFKHYIRQVWMYQETENHQFVLDLGLASGINK
jgi:hypothetical protein